MRKKAPVRFKIRIKKNDLVEVIAGKDAGKRGKILKVLRDKGRVIVQGVGFIKRHTRPNPQRNIKGGIAYGSTNADGTDVKDNEVDVLGLYATVYKALGIDPSPQQVADVRDNLGRPYYIAGDKPKWVKDLLTTG